MEEYFKKIEDKEVPQLSPKTGVSLDYTNQISGFIPFFKNKGIDSVKNLLKQLQLPFHMKKYEEVYSEYTNVVNDKNREAIKKLDELTTQINDILKDPDHIDENAFKKACNEIYFLIRGDNSIEI